jgi:hypothetical protein
MPLRQKPIITRGKKMKISAIYPMLLFLNSCGGGGGSGPIDAGDGSGDEISTSNMADLDVSSDFAFIGGETLTITIVDESTSIERHYLNICSDFSDDNGVLSVIYESCQLRTSLQGQHSAFAIVISSNQQEFIAQIWPLHDDALPSNHRWSRSEDGNDWQITLN